MNPNPINTTRMNLYNQLFLYGDFIPLKIVLDPYKIQEQLKQFESSWIPYNKDRVDSGRSGLSITSRDGSLVDEISVKSLYQISKNSGLNFSENDFDQPTPVADSISELGSLLKTFDGGLSRSRFVRMRAGGFFPPHRDQSIKYQVPDYFRLFAPLQNCGKNTLYFVYDGKIINYDVGRIYLFNALKVHAVFSFVDDATIMAMSLKLNQENISAVLRQLEVN